MNIMIGEIDTGQFEKRVVCLVWRSTKQVEVTLFRGPDWHRYSPALSGALHCPSFVENASSKVP